VTDALSAVVARWRRRLVAVDDLDGPVVVGCSGGADSLALLALLHGTGHDVHAVYVDHGLRDRSTHDAGVVRSVAQRLAVPFEVRSVTVHRRGSLEANARAGRYAALADARREIGAHAVAVGHTRDDQAETVLLNLLRGAGTTGLAGMPARRGDVVRPLLELRRADTAEICSLLGFVPVHDTMNDDVRHRRVWLRREVLPRLAAGARRDVVDVVARQADLLRDEDAYLDALTSSCVPVTPTGALDVAALLAAPLPLARRAVRRWLGPPPVPSDSVDAVLAVARGERRAALVPGGRRIERLGPVLNLLDGPAAVPEEAVLDVPGSATFGSYALDAWVEHAAPVWWPDGRSAAVVDADALGSTVVVRPPRAGERFRPLGRGGSKLVHDALSEAGVPAGARAAHPVVASAGGDVCWVVGYRIADHVKVTARTRRYCWITIDSEPQE
jgi:tRNA(Ile)-lysidine synthase